VPGLGGQPTRNEEEEQVPIQESLLSLDATVIDLCATMFDWAKFRLTKGAVKLHLLLDHDGYLPSFAVISEGKNMRCAWRGRCNLRRGRFWCLTAAIRTTCGLRT